MIEFENPSEVAKQICEDCGIDWDENATEATLRGEVMKFWTDEETGARMSRPDCVDEWLFDIWAIGVDYDGCHTVKELKKLIDELVDMSNKARECLWENKLFGIHGKPEWRE